MRCRQAKFTVVNRRHHCRNCGYVICGDCSKRRFLLVAQSEEPLRVCNTCFDSLSNNNVDAVRLGAKSSKNFFLHLKFCLNILKF